MFDRLWTNKIIELGVRSPSGKIVVIDRFPPAERHSRNFGIGKDGGLLYKPTGRVLPELHYRVSPTPIPPAAAPKAAPEPPVPAATARYSPVMARDALLYEAALAPAAPEDDCRLWRNSSDAFRAAGKKVPEAEKGGLLAITSRGERSKCFKRVMERLKREGRLRVL